jgi:hypothetical protein
MIFFSSSKEKPMLSFVASFLSSLLFQERDSLCSSIARSGKQRRAPKSIRLWLEQLEDRLAPATFTWAGTSSTDWNYSPNWNYTPDATFNRPTASDTVVVPTGTPSCLIGINAAASSINVSGNLGVKAGGSLTVGSAMTVSGLAYNYGSISTGSIALSGELSGSGSVHASNQFTNSGTILPYTDAGGGVTTSGVISIDGATYIQTGSGTIELYVYGNGNNSQVAFNSDMSAITLGGKLTLNPILFGSLFAKATQRQERAMAVLMEDLVCR